MPIPSLPAAHLVLIQANLALGQFADLLNRPPRPSGSPHLGHGRVDGRVDQVLGPPQAALDGGGSGWHGSTRRGGLDGVARKPSRRHVVPGAPPRN